MCYKLFSRALDLLKGPSFVNRNSWPITKRSVIYGFYPWRQWHVPLSFVVSLCWQWCLHYIVWINLQLESFVIAVNRRAWKEIPLNHKNYWSWKVFVRAYIFRVVWNIVGVIVLYNWPDENVYNGLDFTFKIHI